MVDRDPLAARLLATFLDELEEQLRLLDADLLALETEPGDADRIRAVFRVMHTLKGAARAAGVRPIEELCHELETRLATSRAAGWLDPRDLPLLFAASDALADAGRRLRANDRVDSALLAALGQQLRGIGAANPAMRTARSGTPRPAMDLASPPPAPPTPVEPAAPNGAEAEQSRVASQPAAEQRSQSSEPVRLAARQVESLVGAAGDVLAATSGIAGRPDEASSLYDALVDWRRTWNDARRTLGAMADRTGDPAATRAMLERLEGSIGAITRDAGRLTRVLADDARALSGTAARFQDNVRRLSLRPFGDVVEALPRVVRDVAMELAKDVRLVIEGQDVEADRAVLDVLRDPLLHVVRNAVDHGIELPADRERRGKPVTGTITVRASTRGDLLVVSVTDDGAGIDVSAVRTAIERRGSPAPSTDADTTRLLLDGGVSTRSTATAISGRGVGLDIVRAATDRLGGTVDVASTRGSGTTFTITVPVNASTVRALMVTVGSAMVAIPASAVRRAMRVRRDALRHAQGQLVVSLGGVPMAVSSLSRVLGWTSTVDDDASMLIGVVVEHGTRRGVVLVDDVADERELVVRPIDHLDARAASQFIGGALIDATRVALVVNPAVLVAGARDAGLAAAVSTELTPSRRSRILVVDDSITTRTLEESVLTAAGYDVITAVDGVDGWRLIQVGGIDLVMTDVEMPRMDGIALCERIRASGTYANLPVVIVTSLDRPEERARGLEAGADAYVTKSSFDQDTLLEIVEQLLESRP